MAGSSEALTSYRQRSIATNVLSQRRDGGRRPDPAHI